MGKISRAHVAAGVVALGLVGSLLGAWSIRAEEPPKPIEKAIALKTLAETTATLQHPAGLTEPFVGNVKELFDLLGEKHGVVLRLDPTLFNKDRFGEMPYEKKITLPYIKGLTLRDLLEEFSVQMQIDGDNLFRSFGLYSRPGQIIIGKRFYPATTPGEYKTTSPPPPIIPSDEIGRILYGPTVYFAVENKTLAEIASYLRDQTGANIVIDPFVKEQAEIKITLILNETKLLTALKIAGDMCDVAPAVVDNVFYITTKTKAAELMSETEKNLFGVPTKQKKK